MTKSNFELVKDFMRVFEQNTRGSLRAPDTSTLKMLDFRARHLREEQGETEHATNSYIYWATAKIDGNITDEFRRARAIEAAPEIIDGLIDQLYIIYGTLHSFGVDADEAFNRVHISNMSKLDSEGKPIFRKDGKVMKGPNFKLPEFSDLIIYSMSSKI
jgi:predicted HAD superfamily Cof-like phosphohydrolase